jgi:hypothetical protein
MLESSSCRLFCSKEHTFAGCDLLPAGQSCDAGASCNLRREQLGHLLPSCAGAAAAAARSRGSEVSSSPHHRTSAALAGTAAESEDAPVLT